MVWVETFVIYSCRGVCAREKGGRPLTFLRWCELWLTPPEWFLWVCVCARLCFCALLYSIWAEGRPTWAVYSIDDFVEPHLSGKKHILLTIKDLWQESYLYIKMLIRFAYNEVSYLNSIHIFCTGAENKPETLSAIVSLPIFAVCILDLLSNNTRCYHLTGAWSLLTLLGFGAWRLWVVL